MKLITKALPAVLALGLITAGPAAAYSITDINQSVIAPTARLSVEDGVVTLRGTVEANIDKALLENAAEKLDGVVKVQNYLLVTQ